MKMIYIFILGLLTTSICQSDELTLSKAWCSKYNGNSKLILADGTKPDCDLENYVVEVEHLNKSSKAYEAIGQALHYSTLTTKPPIIAYYFSKPEHVKYLDRIKNIIIHKNLDIKLCNLNQKCEYLDGNPSLQIAETITIENNSNSLVPKPKIELDKNEFVPVTCSRYCIKSIACGDSCISKNKNCTKPKGTACNKSEVSDIQTYNSDDLIRPENLNI
jgi:hypothetical protein